MRKCSSTRHPLRVPGMKPGEGCYICKSKTHIAKVCFSATSWHINKSTELKSGGLPIHLYIAQGPSSHTMWDSNSPSTRDGGSLDSCDRSHVHVSSHGLHLLVLMRGTKFASCFICKEHGHISKNCPQNKHGVYPMGGCCKVCGSVAHLVKDCPDKLNRDSTPTKSSRFDATPRGKLTKFSTGMILRTISMKSLKVARRTRLLMMLLHLIM
uniref:CCHC-type domain-containing protein n=1 Tax=Brassica campestris TaxID=3711 RepID=A0A3P6CFC6_BRACM|nr:unnamed protein product [Brassica rapa]